MKRLFLFFYLSVVSIVAFAAEQFVIFTPAGNHFPLIATHVIPFCSKVSVIFRLPG